MLLPVVAVPGLTPDSLGNYLASLGLVRVAARRWPSVRLAWHDIEPCLVGGPMSLEDLLDTLSAVAADKSWTPYERRWAEPQKQSTKAKSATPAALYQATTDEKELELLAAHVVPAAKLFFNPLLGSGGNAGKRDFSDGWTRAVEALAPTNTPKKGQPDAAGKRRELSALLRGEPTTWTLEKLNAASWFSAANKLYNSGQTAFSEGVISPWAMVLACEGLAFFAGGASRRLGSRARAVGAFPFVVNGAAPREAGEAGRDLAEVWAPLWERPMTVREIATLFQRGRAEIGGRGAVTPAAFATAVTRRGIDAGISEFRRFVLGRTTSANTFEPRYEGAVVVRQPQESTAERPSPQSQATADALEQLLDLLDKLPRDEKKGDRWRYVGLRGRLEASMVRVAADPDGPEAICEVLDAAVAALDRVDRNRAFRDLNIQWRPLPTNWIENLFGIEAADVEARLALALVSSFPASLPFALYRFGIENKNGRFVHPQVAPARWIWSGGAIADPLTDVLLRRTLDWERAGDLDDTNKPLGPVRVQPPILAPLRDVEAWLAGDTDDEALSRWLARFALFDWPRDAAAPCKPSAIMSGRGRNPAGLSLFGLLNPLFDLRPMNWNQSTAGLSDQERNWRTPIAARTIAMSLIRGDVAGAIDITRRRYAMAGHPLAALDAPWQLAEPSRLLASLLFPIEDTERAKLLRRWLRPHRKPEGDEL
jgi:CRISPR-associated protein Csx17